MGRITRRSSPNSRSTTVLAREDDAQGDDFEWSQVEVDCQTIIGKHRGRSSVGLFKEINPLDLLHRAREAKCRPSAIAVGLVEAQDEPFPFFGPLQAAKRKRQTVEREEVIHPSLRSVARCRDGDQRRVQRERFVHDIALGPVSRMWKKAVGEGMATFVCSRVRVERAA